MTRNPSDGILTHEERLQNVVIAALRMQERYKLKFVGIQNNLLNTQFFTLNVDFVEPILMSMQNTIKHICFDKVLKIIS